MKAKMYSLRNQKIQVESRILEMQSSIASLQDEQRAMRLGLEEKQNEITILTERETEESSNKENPQVIANLTEILKQKEAEIEDLKLRVALPVKVWSVSTDDPSIPSVNFTESGSSTAWNKKMEGSEKKEESGERSELAYDNAGKSTGSEGRSENDKENDRNEDADRRGMTEEKLQKPEHSQHNGAQDRVDAEKTIDKKNDDARDEGDIKVQQEKSNTNATESNGKNATIDEENRTATDGQYENLKFSQENEGQKLGTISEGGVKLKMADGFQNSANVRVRGRHGYLTKGKRWRMIAKNRRLEHNGDFAVTGTANMRSSRISKAQEKSEMSMASTEDHLESSNGHQNRNIDSILNVHLIEEKGKLDISKKSEQGEGLRLRRNDQDGVNGREEEDGSINRSVVNGEASNITDNGRRHKHEDGIVATMEQERSGSNNKKGVAVNPKVANVHEEPDELGAEDNPDSNTIANAADGEVIMESGSEIEDDREEYKEETDASEF